MVLGAVLGYVESSSEYTLRVFRECLNHGFYERATESQEPSTVLMVVEISTRRNGRILVSN